MEKITSNRAGNIVRQPSGYDAFIPHPLFPNGPQLSLDLETVNLISSAHLDLGELKGITNLLPDPDLFVAFYVRKEALLSSQIEGTQCSLDEILQVNETTQETKPVHEVVNYIDAMNYGLGELAKIPMSLRLIHKIHEKVLDNVRGKDKTPGEYKRSQNWIGPPGSNLKEAAFVPPPPNLMLDLMGDFENYYHAEDQLPPLVKAAILHAHFETIHPYLDGNGRLGRLLITFMLCEKQILHKPLLYLSLFFKENRSKYYELLMNVRFKGEWEEWIKFFLRGVRNTSQEAASAAREILSLQKKDTALIKEHLAQHKISYACYDLICRRPILSIPDTAKALDVSYPAVKQVFDGLIDLKILQPYDQKERNKQFHYVEYLNILRRGT